jgi:chromatin segregation and condensation protein Rec8/ScpA/Scc1 (kleisin family)/tRNA nucleotidyltransferase/poly(A) polymerase
VTEGANDIGVLAGLAEDDLELLRKLGVQADEAGTMAYVVGGLVRDLLLGLHNYDLDVVVEGDAVVFAKEAAESLGGTVKAHTRFGTVVLVLPGGRKVDLASARSEVYERPGALPTVTPGAMESDLKRRDFTINSMAAALNPGRFGELLDPFGGREDLERRVLRVLTDASFEDDPTRILRGVRFSARFGLSMDPGTEALLRRAVDERRTETVSGERLFNEIQLILQEDDAWPPVFRLIDWGILSSMVPGWDVPLSVRDVFVAVERLHSEATREKEDSGEAGPSRWRSLLLALLTPVSVKVREAVVDRLASGRRVRELVRGLGALETQVLPELGGSDEPKASRLFELLNGFADETLIVGMALVPDSQAERRIGRFIAELRGTRPSLTGHDLREMGLPEGREIGSILAALRSARLDEEVTSVQEERELVRRLAGNLTNEARGDSVARDRGDTGAGERDPEKAGEMMQQEAKLSTTATAEAPPEAPHGEAERSGAASEEPARPLVQRPVYEVRLDAFEGPLDLLLHLIREHEIDIYDIPIAVITEQYLEYISFMESLDLSLAGEFLEMAATLIRIKVQMLLPRETDEGEEEEDPREQLVRKLVEYKQFKEVASGLSEKEQQRRDYFPRGVDPRSYSDLEEDEGDIEDFLRDVTLFDLVDSLREVLSRVPERVEVHAVDMEEVTVEEQIGRIRSILSERGSVPFTEVFGERASRYEIVATFIALLELIRLGEVKAVQKRNFGDIEILAKAEE